MQGTGLWAGWLKGAGSTKATILEPVLLLHARVDGIISLPHVRAGSAKVRLEAGCSVAPLCAVNAVLLKALAVFFCKVNPVCPKLTQQIRLICNSKCLGVIGWGFKGGCRLKGVGTITIPSLQ